MTSPLNLLSPWASTSFFRGLLGGDFWGAWRLRAAEGESGRPDARTDPGAWRIRTTLQIPISYVSGFLLG
eukprot:1145735-Pelagomonas_calceolata.AAC.5